MKVDFESKVEIHDYEPGIYRGISEGEEKIIIIPLFHTEVLFFDKNGTLSESSLDYARKLDLVKVEEITVK